MPFDGFICRKKNFDYDDNENLAKVTLPNGVFVEYSYDNAQRLTGIGTALATLSPIRSTMRAT